VIAALAAMIPADQGLAPVTAAIALAATATADRLARAERFGEPAILSAALSAVLLH
jgi:hypothetical protein